MIDIHSHILPGIDDGPKDMEEAVQMALLAQNSGTEKIIATPHFSNGVYEVDRTAVDDAVGMFSRELWKRKIPVEVFPGAEIRITHDTCRMFEKGMLPSLARSDYYLFELPNIVMREGICLVFRQLRERGVIPVIAHPERNYTLMKTPGLIKDLVFENVLFQLTGDSVSGKNGKICQRISKEMIQAGQAHFIASDGHDLEFRKPSLQNVFKMVKKIASEKTARMIMIENPKMILARVSGVGQIRKKVS